MTNIMHERNREKLALIEDLAGLSDKSALEIIQSFIRDNRISVTDVFDIEEIEDEFDESDTLILYEREKLTELENEIEKLTRQCDEYKETIKEMEAEAKND